MSDEKKSEEAANRYHKAAHAVQAGVAMKMNYDSRDTEPKHLRMGVNARAVDQGALVTLLISKGLFTDLEYTEALADAMEKEQASYELELSEHIGTKITLV
jgi:hypothetical protein